jgi:hypothetical protein
MNVSARSHEPISHPAQRGTAEELVLLAGGYWPAIVSRYRNAAAVGRVRARLQRRERRQRGSPEKRNKLAPFHSSLSFTTFARSNISDDLFIDAISEAT